MSLSQKHSEIQVNNAQFRDDPNDSGSGNWLTGYFSLWVGMIAVQLVALAFIMPLVVATVLAARIFGSEQMGPITTIWLLYSPAWIWFVFRFYFPALLGLFKLSGFFMQKLSGVRPSDTLAVVRERAMDLVYDLKILTWRFHGKN